MGAGIVEPIYLDKAVVGVRPLRLHRFSRDLLVSTALLTFTCHHGGFRIALVKLTKFLKKSSNESVDNILGYDIIKSIKMRNLRTVM